jgi:glutaredoxin 3
MSSPHIVVYCKSWCPYCASAHDLLTSKGVSFQEIDIDAQPRERAEMIRRSGRYTVPQIFIGERHIGGSDDLHELDRAGELDKLLQAVTADPPSPAPRST